MILRHRHDPRDNVWGKCARCGKVKGNLIHRLGGRCSMCHRYFRHYELDGSRRCDECRP